MVAPKTKLGKGPNGWDPKTGYETRKRTGMRTGMSRVPMLIIPAPNMGMLLQTRSTTNNRVSR